MINDLKKEITDCYMYGEIICQQGFGPKPISPCMT